MSDSPEGVVRGFLATWEHPSVDDLERFMSDDVVYVDFRGVQRGLEAFKELYGADIQVTPSTIVDIRSIASTGGTVMVERVDTYPVQGKTFTLEAVSVADVGRDGKITRWREYFDWKSLSDQLEAAGIAVPL